jgi:hypothetical protein
MRMKKPDTHMITGILLLYRHPLRQDASTIMEHLNSFARHSCFRVWSLNTELGFPEGLQELEFQILVLHYSLFGTGHYYFDDKFLDYLARSAASYKIAFFQDEYQYCQKRFAFLHHHRVDCVYTLLEPAHFQEVYQKYTTVPKVVYTLPGYVSDDLVALAQVLSKPDSEREVDIGYRGRRLPYYMGKGAQEKYEIAVGFKQRANALGLKLDIETEESKRIYGQAWYEFIANCRALLGVEAGVSIFDLDDAVRIECERLLALNPDLSFEEIPEQILRPWEGNIPYRTISPRHFEAAAFRTCQILFEGEYSGILRPMVHYIPLKKDFSNFEEVICLFKDRTLRYELSENAHRDLIASGQYTYRKFLEDFDRELFDIGFRPEVSAAETEYVTALLDRGRVRRQLYAGAKAAVKHLLSTNKVIGQLAEPIFVQYGRRKLKS